MPFNETNLAARFDAGWVGSLKLNGVRAVVQVPEEGERLVMVSRHGRKIRGSVLPYIEHVIRDYEPGTVLDGEWMRYDCSFWAFDVLATPDKVLVGAEAYTDRWARLRGAYKVPLVTDAELALSWVCSREDCEGLVLRGPAGEMIRSLVSQR